jgi:flagellar basal-body rod protein FlgF
MADGIYISMCGAVARQAQLDAVADNLANAQTPGFKASRPAFEAFLPSSGAADKRYTAAVASGTDLSPGAIQKTGEPLDLVPEGSAFLTVRLGDGGLAYTRDGRVTLDAEHRLTAGGRLLVGRDGLPITVPPEVTPRIDPSGAVRHGDDLLGELALATLEGPVDRIAPALLAPGAGGRAVPSEAGVRAGELEVGNSTPLEAALALVTAQRSYDASMQAIQAYKQMDQRATEVARVK